MYIKAEKTRLEKTKYKYAGGTTYIGSKIGTLSANTQYVASQDCVLYGNHSIYFSTAKTSTVKITLNIQVNGVNIRLAEVSTEGLAANKRIRLDIGINSDGSSSRGIFIPKDTIISLIETYPSGGTKTIVSSLDIYTPMDSD